MDFRNSIINIQVGEKTNSLQDLLNRYENIEIGIALIVTEILTDMEALELIDKVCLKNLVSVGDVLGDIVYNFNDHETLNNYIESANLTDVYFYENYMLLREYFFDELSTLILNLQRMNTNGYPNYIFISYTFLSDSTILFNIGHDMS